MNYEVLTKQDIIFCLLHIIYYTFFRKNCKIKMRKSTIIDRVSV